MTSITVFPTDNGDMVLSALESGRQVLTDINIRETADGIRDVAADLRARLKTDSQGRPYVDAMLLSHPDQDHCRGLEKTFHLGPLADYKDPPKGEPKKIVILEMWSSPLVFRRASKDHKLCSDAAAWNKEARRRVAAFRANKTVGDGDRILILGEDEDGKTDDLGAILVKVNQSFNRINGTNDLSVSVRLLAPHPKGSDDEEELRSKNHSSVITQFAIKAQGEPEACLFLSGGDAGVAIWERLWAEHKGDTKWLRYDLLLTPHHCSWRSLSYDSWSENGEKAKLSKDARSALGQARSGAVLLASSKVIKDDDDDPPCVRAKREYEAIAKDAKGSFENTAIYPSADAPEPMEFEITAGGVKLKSKKKSSAAGGSTGGVGVVPIVHG